MTITASTPGLVAGTWTIDPSHSEVGFTVRHIMSKVRGMFTQFEGSITVADDPLASQARATIDLASIDTRNAQRDEHLRSSDFFEVDSHPAMTFVSTQVRPDGDDYVVAGDLTIKGVTRPVELHLEVLGVDKDPWGRTRAGFEATGSISRKDFGIDFNIPLEGDKVMIGDRVTIYLAVEAVLDEQ